MTTNRFFEHLLVFFRKRGYEIDVAETGKEAIEKSKLKSYDLALIDIRLPDMDGTDLLVKMQQTMHNAIKIMITGFPFAGNRCQGTR